MTDFSAAAGTWKIDDTHTTLGFSARHAMVAKVRGRFTDFEGSFTIDADSPANSTASVTIKTASIDTRNADRDTHLKSADFLDVEKNTELTFASTSIKHVDGNDFVVGGDLTVGDVTRNVEVELAYVGTSQDPWGGTRIGFEGSTEISRKDFGLTWNVALETGGVLVGDKIKIEIDVEAVKQ
ncbi:MAG: YceI family protein [Candidatus Nanopelagicales bacterium]